VGWGDEVMVSGMARVVQQRDPRKVRVMYDADTRWHEAWENNPRIARPDEKGNFQKVQARSGFRRPYIEAKTRERWTWRRWGPPAGELYFSEAERAFGEQHAGLVILEPNLKAGASPNKDWGWERWQALADGLARNGLPAAQLGPGGTRVLAGVRHVVTPGMRVAAAVVAQARLAVLPEGGLHHVAAAVGTPALVIFGGFISPEVTGYATQESFFFDAPRMPLGCGWRIKCDHCAEAMASITPGAVLEKLFKKIGG
jgi:hypothetical protein